MFIEPQQSGDKKLLQNQFNEKPYPDFNFDEPFDANNFNELFKHSFFLPYIKSFQSFCNTSGARILDVGCGSGHKLLYLAKANPGALITAVDFSSESLEVASQRMKFHGIDNIKGLNKVLLGYFHLSHLSILELKSFLLLSSKSI